MKKFDVVLEQDPSGGWTLTAPAVPGHVACGYSEEKVLELAREGIPIHLKCLKDEGFLVQDEPRASAKVVSLIVAA